MELACRLERELLRLTRNRLPREWSGLGAVAGCGTITELVLRVRCVGDDSDLLIDALLAVETAVEVADLVIEVAAVPLARRRSGRDRERFESMLTELALVIAEARRAESIESVRRRLPLLLDRSWDRVRRSPSGFPAVVAESLDHLSDGLDPYEGVLDRHVVEQLRARLAETAMASVGVVRAWNSAVILLDREDRSAADRDRLKYACRILRRLEVGDAAA